MERPRELLKVIRKCIDASVGYKIMIVWVLKSVFPHPTITLPSGLLLWCVSSNPIFLGSGPQGIDYESAFL